MRGVVTKGSVGVCRGPSPTKKGVVEGENFWKKERKGPTLTFPLFISRKKGIGGKGKPRRGKKEEKEGGPLSFSSSSPPPHSEAAFESVVESPKNMQVKVQKLRCFLFFGGLFGIRGRLG